MGNKRAISGVYQIINVVNERRYVGSSNHVLHRRDQHFYDLRKGKSKCRLMQEDYNAMGKDVFLFAVISVVPESELLDEEQKWLDCWKPEYNVNEVAGLHIGDYIRTPEAIEKSKQAKRGRRLHTEEHKEELRQRWLGENNPNFGRKYSDEERSIMSERMMGDKNPNFGTHRSEAFKKRISETSSKTYHGIVSPDGIVYETVTNLSAFCRERGLCVSSMVAVLHGRIRHHKGWTAIK